jgi:tetratricopeptide (TPR) repeat protein
MKYIPLNLALVYLIIAAVTNPACATTVDPISTTKPIPIACYIKAVDTKNDNPGWIDNEFDREIKAGNLDRVFQLQSALKFKPIQKLRIQSAIIRSAITNNRNDIIDASITQIVQLNSQLTRENPAYLSESWSLPLNLAQDLIKAGRLKQGIVLLKYVETISPQISGNDLFDPYSGGDREDAFPAPNNDTFFRSPLQLRLLIKIADNYIKIERIAEASPLLQQVQQQTNKLKNPEERAFTSYLLAQSYLRLQQPQIALDLIVNSREQIANSTDIDRQIALLVAIAKTYQTAGKSELALQVVQQSTQIATKSNDINFAASSLALISSTASELGQMQLATNLFKQSTKLAKQVPNQDRYTIWLGIATHFKQPAQREQLATVLQQYQNLANRQTRTTVFRNVFRQWMAVKDFKRAIPVARQLIKIAKQNGDDQALTDIIDLYYLNANVAREIQPILPEFIAAVQSLPTVDPKSFRDRQLNAHKFTLLSQIDRVYLELGQIDLALTFAKTADNSIFEMTRNIISWLAEKQEFDRALTLARSLPTQVRLTAEQQQFSTDSTLDIRSSALADVIRSAIRQDKLNLAQKLIPELSDPNIRAVSSMELAEAYLFKKNDPTTANRILTTVKPTAVYQKYVENLQQLTNCAMKN